MHVYILISRAKRRAGCSYRLVAEAVCVGREHALGSCLES